MTKRRVYGQRGLTVDGNKDWYDGWRPTIKDHEPDECPRQRGDTGPCPYVSCRHHLWGDVTFDGALRVYHPDIDPWELPATCAVDLSMQGNMAVEDIAEVMGLTRERVRQILMIAISKLAARDESFGEAFEDWKEGHRHGGFLDTGRVDGNKNRGERTSGGEKLSYQDQDVVEWKPLGKREGQLSFDNMPKVTPIRRWRAPANLTNEEEAIYEQLCLNAA